METYTIYKATNLINNKVYIGFTSQWPKRINGHNYDRRYGNAKYKAFYKAIAKYGWENFNWTALYQSKDKHHTLKEMEPYFINEYRSWVGFDDCNGYNITKGGDGTFGWKRSSKLIEAHRAMLKGRKQTKEHIEKRTKSRIKNNPIGWSSGLTAKTDERLANLGRAVSKKLKGVPKSESHKLAMRNRPQDTLKLTCPYCKKIGDYKNMKRWHMDNCKFKNIK